MSYPRWELFTYVRDVQGLFGQTAPYQCALIGPNNPYFPETTLLTNDLLNVYYNTPPVTYEEVMFHYDYFPMSWFGIHADFNPMGASKQRKSRFTLELEMRYSMPSIFRERFAETAGSNSYITVPSTQNPDGTLVDSSFVAIPGVLTNFGPYGKSFTLSFWIKVTPKEFNERFPLVSIVNVE